MTAFAPHTTGIPIGAGKSLEIAKQLFDVAVLIDGMVHQQTVQHTYRNTVSEELAYRGLKLSPEDVLRDTVKACSCIISRGTLEKEDYQEYIKGIRSVGSHIISSGYNGEIAANQACKVMYLAACLLTGGTFHKIEHPEDYINQNLGKSIYRKLSYMKKQKLEAYGYLVEAVRLLNE